MMHMTFYWGKQVTLLFDDWKTKSWAGYCLSLVAVFLFAVFHQYIVHLRSRFKGVSAGKAAPELRRPLLRRRAGAFASKVGESVLFGADVALGYFLMLAVMSFNGGVFIAAVIGFFVGHLVFRSGREEEESTENACGCA